jgi:hypothetical protein
MNLFIGHDLKFDRDIKVKRIGTPVDKMLANELPSPVTSSLLAFNFEGEEI